jgi:hypothetical protein
LLPQCILGFLGRFDRESFARGLFRSRIPSYRCSPNALYRIPSGRILFDGIGPLQGGASELHFTYPGVRDPGTLLCKSVIAA